MADLVIDEMVLKIGGLGKREADELAHRLVEVLATRLPDLPDRTLDRLQIDLPPPGLAGPRLADWLVDRIVEAVS